jgi:hypothetical protein
MFQLHVSTIVELAIVRLKINYRRKSIIQSGMLYIKRGGGTTSRFTIDGMMCSDGGHVEAICKCVLVMRTYFLVSSVGVSICRFVGWGRPRNLPCLVGGEVRLQVRSCG